MCHCNKHFLHFSFHLIFQRIPWNVSVSVCYRGSVEAQRGKVTFPRPCIAGIPSSSALSSKFVPLTKVSVTHLSYPSDSPFIHSFILSSTKSHSLVMSTLLLYFWKIGVLFNDYSKENTKQKFFFVFLMFRMTKNKTLLRYSSCKQLVS